MVKGISALRFVFSGYFGLPLHLQDCDLIVTGGPRRGGRCGDERGKQMEWVATGLCFCWDFFTALLWFLNYCISHSIEGGQQTQMTTILFSVFYHVI